jgi:hypothetical protein
MPIFGKSPERVMRPNGVRGRMFRTIPDTIETYAMKKIILTYGAIAGFVTIGGVILGLALAKGSESMAFLKDLGFLVMLASFSLIFIGIKRHRDEDLGGVIRFGTAFSLGLGITLIASVIYMVVWEFNLMLTDYAFMNDYASSIIADAREAGGSAAQIETLVADMDDMKANYSNPLFRLPMTFLEIFPVGLLISLISAWILRRSEVLPAK